MKAPLALILLCHALVATPASLFRGGTFGRTEPVRAPDARLTTNAQRLAAGLTPLPPKRHFGSRTGALKPRQSSGTTIVGKVVVRDVGSDAVETNVPGFTPSSTFSLNTVDHTLTDITFSGLSIPVVGVLIQNDPTTPDVKSDNPNYVSLSYRAPMATAQEAIWSYVPPTQQGEPGQLTATWVNEDNSEANTIMLARFSVSGNASLYIVSDPNSDAVAAIQNLPLVSEVVQVTLMVHNERIEATLDVPAAYVLLAIIVAGCQPRNPE
ncbi:hypothetical protein FRB99_002767 [Tulasnella sp. 403]|nr:hypothetical protein FRB99_002767 [Tulasnella sp. 403]